MKIEYWSDYACPYCYIGEAHLEQALKTLEINDAQINMKAFELDPYAPATYQGPTVERFARKYGLSIEQAAERVESISHSGHAAGLEFEYAKTRYTNTFDAHRLTKFAREKLGNEAANKLSTMLFDAYFAQEKELSNHEVLVNSAVEVGLDADEVNELLLSDDYAAEVREDERAAAASGIHGVPYFVINDTYTVSGALPTPEFIKLLVKAAEEAESSEAQAQTCGPDGCRI